MESYKIEFKRSAERDIRKINSRLIPNIFRKINTLADNPFPRQSLKLCGTEATYRLRVGDYRVVYEVDAETNIIVVHYIRHRGEVYRKL